jgi:hypothetical protein
MGLVVGLDSPLKELHKMMEGIGSTLEMPGRSKSVKRHRCAVLENCRELE